jgi:hypothetical protein
MMSPEQEFVPFVTAVDPKNKNIEFWMGEVKEAMTGQLRLVCDILPYSRIFISSILYVCDTFLLLWSLCCSCADQFCWK